jgi:hypothetical protein
MGPTSALALLDTDTVSDILKRKDQAVRKKASAYLRQHGQFAFSAITRYQAARGLRRKRASAQLHAEPPLSGLGGKGEASTSVTPTQSRLPNRLSRSASICCNATDRKPQGAGNPGVGDRARRGGLPHLEGGNSGAFRYRRLTWCVAKVARLPPTEGPRDDFAEGLDNDWPLMMAYVPAPAAPGTGASAVLRMRSGSVLEVAVNSCRCAEV